MNSIKLINDEAAFESAYTTRFKLEVDGVEVAPTSGTASLNTPSGVSVVVDRACTLDGNILECAFIASELETKEEDYRIILTYIYDGDTHVVNFLIDVVLTPIVLTVSDSNLKIKHPNIMSSLWKSYTTYSLQIEDAFKKVKEDIKNVGKRPDMILDGSQISNLIELKSLQLIYFDFATKNDGINWDRYVKYKEDYGEMFKNIHIKYDSDRDGVIDEKDLPVYNLGFVR